MIKITHKHSGVRLSNKHKDEIAAQIEAFFGLAILSMIVAALHWHGNAVGNWGNWIACVGRAVDTLLCFVLAGFLWLKRKMNWKWVLGFLGGSLVTLWIGFWIASVSVSYGLFIGIFVALFAYVIWLCSCLLRDGSFTEKERIIVNKIIDKVVIARKIAWMALLLVGILQAWVEMDKDIDWLWPTLISLLSIVVVGILFFNEIKKNENPQAGQTH